MISRRFLSLALSFGFLFSTCLLVQGQSTYGSITGSVADPSGAAITDAQDKVEAKQSEVMGSLTGGLKIPGLL